VGAQVSGTYQQHNSGSTHELVGLTTGSGGPVYVLPPGIITGVRAAKPGVQVQAPGEVQVPPTVHVPGQPVARRVFAHSSGFEAVVDAEAEGLTVVLADRSGSMKGEGITVCRR
jgi:hypothetical protein